jgi:hypothetical protein
MEELAPNARRFISAVRVRLGLVRMVESIAVAIAIGAALGIILAGLLWWRGQSAGVEAEGLIGLGFFLGTLIGLSRWPTRKAAACEADRQLGLHDLLGTLHTLDTHLPAEWRQTLAAFAEHRCAGLSPSMVVASRLGVRAYTGIGILTALLLTSALFTARPAAVIASDAPGASAGDTEIQARKDGAAGATISAAVERPPGPGGVDAEDGRTFAAERSVADRDGVTGSAGRSKQSSGSNAGLGSGLARTESRTPAGSLPDAANKGEDNAAFGAGTGGDGAGSAGGRTGDNSTKNSPEAGKAEAAPWDTQQWAGDAARADREIDAGRIPAADEDLVRAYFQRD